MNVTPAITINTDYHKVTADTEALDMIDRFTAHDMGQRTGGHRARPTTEPTFTLRLTDKDNVETRHEAYIVAVADSSNGSIGPNQPVAVAAFELEGDTWHVMIVRKTAMDSWLHIEDNLVAIEGDPEQLMLMADAFTQS